MRSSEEGVEWGHRAGRNWYCRGWDDGRRVGGQVRDLESSWQEPPALPLPVLDLGTSRWVWGSRGYVSSQIIGIELVDPLCFSGAPWDV